MKEDDSDATRTLFVGNMPADIRESEIRRVFEKYGKVEDVDIKTPPETNAAYAFVLFQVFSLIFIIVYTTNNIRAYFPNA